MALDQALKETTLPEEAPPRPAGVPAFAWRAQPAVLARGALVALPLLGWQSRNAPFDAVQTAWRA